MLTLLIRARALLTNRCLFLFALSILFFIDSAYAQELTAGTASGCGSDSMFSPPCSDKSVEYLSRIFGQVGGVLTGAEGTMLQEMFSVFNAAVLGLGSIVIMYTLFVGTIKTAHEGELLGQKWSSIWIPLKSALGIIMIVPAKASGGYSFIQVFFMWVIIQGVGAADTLWTTILQSLADEKPVIAQPMMVGSKNAFKQAFQGLVCMYALNKIEDPAGAPTYTPTISGDTIYFTAGPYGNRCGYAKVAPGGNVTGSVPTAAMQESINILQEAAMSVVYEDESQWPANAITKAVATYAATMSATVANYKKNNGSQNTMNDAMTRARDMGWIFAGSYYYDIARIQDRISLQVFNVPDVSVNPTGGFTQDADFAPPSPEDKRAIFGAAVGKGLIYLNKYKVYGSASQYAQAGKAGSFSDPSGQGASTIGGQLWGDLDKPRSDLVGGSTDVWNSTKKVATGITSPEKLTQVPADSPVREVTDFLYDSLNDILSFFQEHMSGEDPDTGRQINPMFAMQTFGTYVLAIVELIWVTVTVILALLVLAAAGAGMVSAFTLGIVGADKVIVPTYLGIMNFLMWVISWLGPILFLMFAIGGILSHYVPLIPFLYFTFGAIGWLMLCFEAIVAAPIVALGILHPEEHDIFGKASPAIMLLVNVFLTPSLMLFGMIGAMMISYVVVSMVNFGFYNAMIAFTGINEGSAMGQIVVAITSITTFVAFIVIYCGTIMFAVEKSFSLIPELRTKVLTWIGGQAAGFGEEKSLGDVKGKYQEGSKATGEMVQKGGEKVGEKATSKGASMLSSGSEGQKTQTSYSKKDSVDSGNV